MFAIIHQLVDNVREYKRNFIFDCIVLFVCFLLFELNNLLIKNLVSLSDGFGGHANNLYHIVGYISHNHLNDFIGGCAFLAYTNFLLDFVNPQVRFRKFVPCVLFIFLCGLFWELVAPVIIKSSTTDPLDLIAYVFGAVIYWSINHLVSCKSTQ